MQKIFRSPVVSFRDLLLHKKQKKSFVSLNNEINKVNQRKKIWGDVFLFNRKPHACKNSGTFEEKNTDKKSSLSMVLHSPIQLLLDEVL